MRYLRYSISTFLLLACALTVEAAPRLRITVDTLCSGWNVCVYDSNDPGGLKKLYLLNDPYGNVVVGDHRKYNCSLDTNTDSDRDDQATFTYPFNNYCFQVFVDDPADSAYVPLFIIDAKGNSVLMELKMKAKAVTILPKANTTVDFFSYYWRDHFTVNQPVAKDLAFTNHKSSQKDITITKCELANGLSRFFKILQPPKFPLILKPGDTLFVTVSFESPDTLIHTDSITIETDCFNFGWSLYGEAAVGLLVAEDVDFGKQFVGSTVCRDVELKNTSLKYPLTITEDYIFKADGEGFIFNPSAIQNRMPRTLAPGQAHKFRVCFQPVKRGHISGSIQWDTDTPSPYDTILKTTSALRGFGLQPAIEWSEKAMSFRADTSQEDVKRLFLLNTGNIGAELNRIYIDGADADEFRVVATSFSFSQAPHNDVVIDEADSMWVDISFKPDMTKTPKFRKRTANLRAHVKLDSLALKTVTLSAVFPPAEVRENNAKPTFMSSGHNSVILDPGPRLIKEIQIVDILGRLVKVTSQNIVERIEINTSGLSPGRYFARIRYADDQIETLKFEVVH